MCYVVCFMFYGARIAIEIRNNDFDSNVRNFNGNTYYLPTIALKNSVFLKEIDDFAFSLMELWLN